MVQSRPRVEPPTTKVGPLFPVRLPTHAEARVLELVALGLTSREIAERLWISRQGVTYHIGNLFRKLRATTRAGLVARAYATGLLEPGRWPPAMAPGTRPQVRWSGRQVPGPALASTAAPDAEHTSAADMPVGAG